MALAKGGMDKKGDMERLRLLFLNVIVQATKDAFLVPLRTKGTSEAAKSDVKGRRLIASRAMFWLTEDNKDFYEICDLAGVSADRVRNKTEELLKLSDDERKREVKKLMREQYRQKVKKFL